jgi:hypothetical protein
MSFGITPLLPPIHFFETHTVSLSNLSTSIISMQSLKTMIENVIGTVTPVVYAAEMENIKMD